MSTLQTYLTVIVLSLLIGFGAGFVTSHKFAQATQAIALKDQVDADKKAADARVAAEQKVADDVHQQLVLQQLQSTSLNAQLEDLRKTNASLTDQIAHAHFNPPPRPAVAGSCPGSSINAPEFVRLYNQAAAGTTGTDTPAGHASGMLEIFLPSLRSRIDGTTEQLRHADRSGTDAGDFGEQERRSRRLSTTA